MTMSADEAVARAFKIVDAVAADKLEDYADAMQDCGVNPDKIDRLMAEERATLQRGGSTSIDETTVAREGQGSAPRGLSHDDRQRRDPA